MEITLEAIISLVGLFVGGGGGAFFTWRYMRRKAKAEAVQAEVDAAKDKQEYYRGIIDDLAKDRDYYKGERDDIRERMDKFSRNVMEWKLDTDKTIDDLRRQVARNGRQLDSMRPFMCGDLTCKVRQRVVVSEDGVVEKSRKTTKKQQQTEVEPLEQEDL
jgi:hypothetical protein